MRLSAFAFILWGHTTAATTFDISCVSVDRLIAIRLPFRYQDIITKKRCYTVIILVWLFSLAISFSMLLVKLSSEEDDEKRYFVLQWISINPFIYYFRNEEFRRAFRRTPFDGCPVDTPGNAHNKQDLNQVKTR
ncbi:uncharacterized protein LOC111347551, partial [Stylophora pistillata]|uniref:uncharacterized protein LOC111347551 n=1 Tax=Stylophora pistillata TaxID=50429 RepID=UPI000C051B65